MIHFTYLEWDFWWYFTGVCSTVKKTALSCAGVRIPWQKDGG